MQPIERVYVELAFVKQRGVALLTVLFVLVLLTTLAVYTAEDENIAIRKLENQRDAEQSRQVALGGEIWVAKALQQDLKGTASDCYPNTDCLVDDWAKIKGDQISIEDGKMKVSAYDESGKFNLNNLVDGKSVSPSSTPAAVGATNLPTSAGGANTAGTPPNSIISPWYLAFQDLLDSIGIEIEKADLVVDWIDADNNRGNHGAEDSEYLGADKGPYLSANKQMASVSELAFIEGFTSGEIKKLMPLVTALPVTPSAPPVPPNKYPDLRTGVFNKININTASPTLLNALSGNTFDSTALSQIKQDQDHRGYSNINAVERYYPNNNWAILETMLDVRSEYFSVESCAQFGRVTYALKSVLRRRPNNTSPETTTLFRQRTHQCGTNQANPTPQP